MDIVNDKIMCKNNNLDPFQVNEKLIESGETPSNLFMRYRHRLKKIRTTLVLQSVCLLSDIDDCAADDTLCHNGGTCNNLDGSYECICPTGYFGKHCETGKCLAHVEYVLVM